MVRNTLRIGLLITDYHLSMKREVSVYHLIVFISAFMLSLCCGDSSAQAAKKSRTIATIKEANGQVCFKIQSYASKKDNKKIEFYIDGKAAQLSEVETLVAEELAQIILHDKEMKIEFLHNRAPFDKDKYSAGSHSINGHLVRLVYYKEKLNFVVKCSHCIMPKFLGVDSGHYSNWFQEQLNKLVFTAPYPYGGVFTLSFGVDTVGYVKDIKITSDFDNPIFTEQLRAIAERSPKWTPLSCEGLKRSCYFTFPVILLNGRDVAKETKSSHTTQPHSKQQ